jgi:hypothetical protein
LGELGADRRTSDIPGPKTTFPKAATRSSATASDTASDDPNGCRTVDQVRHNLVQDLEEVVKTSTASNVMNTPKGSLKTTHPVSCDLNKKKTVRMVGNRLLLFSDSAFCNDCTVQPSVKLVVKNEKTENKRGRVTVLKAIHLTKQSHTKEKRHDVVIVLPSLWCSNCYSHRTPSFSLISAFDTQYLMHMKASTDWFRTDFVASFCRLIAHDYHSSTVRLLDCLYPNQTLSTADCIDLPSTMENLWCTAIL